MHKVQQDKEPFTVEQESNNRIFYLVNKGYINFDNVEVEIFTHLESNTSQKRAHITYKIDTGSDGDEIPFKVFKRLFPNSTMAALQKTSHSLNIQPVGFWTIKCEQ